ncbi:MAG TPA: winged helix-turn-helix domain-containing protein [Candidatus Acidoferrales bacterium]|nr:winged helix-turn-helix domain-containing protein [Candidatus Acidoferrales bacterium]
MSLSSPQRIARFGVFEADLRLEELRKRGSKIKIQELPFHVLAMLLERPGEIVTRQELQKRIWPSDTFVDFEDGLNTAIRKLRESLGDDAENPRFVETVPRRGYRFIAPVTVEPTGDPPASPVSAMPQRTAGGSATKSKIHDRVFAVVIVVICAGLVLGWLYWRHRAANPPVAEQRIRSLAVLPFENLSGDPGQDYFADGMTDELTTDIAQLGFLRVTSRSSVMQYKGKDQPIAEIRRQLNVDAVVEGSVARSGDLVRINAQLVETADDRHIWAQSFERDARDIVALQDDVARAVAQTIQLVLQPGEQARLENARPVSVQAYEAYLRGLSAQNRRTADSLNKGVEYFTQATTLDPAFAPAYAGLANSFDLLSDYGVVPGRDAIPKAKTAAQRALALDDSLASAHAALAFALWHYDWDWKTADAEFLRALALNPNDAHAHHWYGLFLAAKRDFSGASRQLQIAGELNPLSLIIQTNVGWVHYYQHDFARSEAEFLKVLEQDSNFTSASTKLWLAYACDGKHPQALQALENDLRSQGQIARIAIIEKANRTGGFDASVQALIDTMHEEAEPGTINPYHLAMLNALIGKKQEALAQLRKADEDRNDWLVYIGIDPAFDSLRSDPEFQKIVADVHIPVAPGSH